MATQQGKRKGLGRGLAALIGEIENADEVANTPTASATAVPVIVSDRDIPIEMIKVAGDNPRRQFNQEELEELTNSIKEHGIVQPILVRPIDKGVEDTRAGGTTRAGGIADTQYLLIAGERRWRAAQKAGVHKIPAVVREVDERQALELALIENIQRADLNPVDEAMGYRKLMKEHEYRQEDLAKVLGKSRSHVANILRLLNLPQKVLDLLAEGQLSSGHARALVPMDDPEPLARRIVKEGLSVRDAEKYATEMQEGNNKGVKIGVGGVSKTADEKALERRLSETIGLKVLLTHKKSGQGKLVINYKTLDELNDFVDRIA